MRSSVLLVSAALLATATAWQPTAVVRPSGATIRPLMKIAAAPEPGVFPQACVKAKAGVAAIASAYCGLTRPLKVAVAALMTALAMLAYMLETSRRAELINTGDKCMDGDEAACTLYDESVQQTPAWKLRMAASKLAQTNLLAEKMQSGPAPAGFKWGKTY